MPTPVILEEERIWKETEYHKGDGFGGTRTILSVKIRCKGCNHFCIEICVIFKAFVPGCNSHIARCCGILILHTSINDQRGALKA